MTDQAAAADVRSLMRDAETGALATLMARGHPYASLVSLATDKTGAPLFLLSRLALHTQNLTRDPRASLLLRRASGPAGEGNDPLAELRATLIGTVSPCAGDDLRARFLVVHPEAAVYIDFADFSFFTLAVERAHLIGGFGRIVDIPGTSIINPPTDL